MLALRANTWSSRIGFAIGAFVIVGWSTVVFPAGIDAIRHDRIMARVEATICSGRLPTGGSLIRCKGLSVQNPFNGNQCGYQVNLWLDTRLSLDSLREFYGRSGQLPSTVHGLVVTSPYVVYEGPGRARVEFLAVGDEGSDLRCT